jgi:hypothetical protein
LANSAALIVGDYSISRPIGDPTADRELCLGARGPVRLKLGGPALMSSPRVRTPSVTPVGMRLAPQHGG